MYEKKQKITCPVCDSERYKVKYLPWVDIHDPIALYGATSGIRGTQTLVICQDCGVIYENPRFPEEIILAGYRGYKESVHDSQHAMRSLSFYNSLKSVQTYLPPKGSMVLDVGTAGGAFLEAAEKFGYESIGLEPSESMAKQGCQRGLNIITGTLSESNFLPSSFDMVCLWDVLEHVAYPKKLLLQVQNILKPQGVLLINYPDIGTWMAKIAGKYFWWILSVHLLQFDRHSLQKICELSGFEIFHFQSYWQTLEFGYLEDMAIHLNLPLSRLIKKLTLKRMQRIPIPYYASQTLALATLSHD